MVEKNKTRTVSEPLTPTGIDAVSGWIAALYGDKIEKREVLRTRFTAEEVLCTWAQSLPAGSAVTARTRTFLGQSSLELSVPGIKSDPYGSLSEEAAAGLKLLQSSGTAPYYRYLKNTNIFTIPLPRRSHPLISMAAAAALGIAAGLLFLHLPGQTGHFILTEIITPLFRTMMQMLVLISMPVIFLSIACGILELGDISNLKKMGSRFVKPVILIPFFCSSLGAALTVPFFRFSSTETLSGEGLFHSLFSMILEIVPGNLIEPLQTGNPLQLIFLAVCFSTALLMLGSRTETISGFCYQLNEILITISQSFCSLMPLFIFLSACSIAASNALAQGSTLLFLLGIVLIAAVVISAVHLFTASTALRINPVLIIKKTMRSFLIELSTASSSAAIQERSEECRSLGVSDIMVKFAVPFTQVVSKPITAAAFFIMVFSTGNGFGLEYTAGQIITGVFVSALLSISAPPVPGSAVACIAILSTVIGLTEPAVALCISVSMLTDYIETCTNCFCQLMQTIYVADRLDMVDRTKLKQSTQSAF